MHLQNDGREKRHFPLSKSFEDRSLGHYNPDRVAIKKRPNEMAFRKKIKFKY